MKPTRFTGRCPICGDQTVDGNTYDSTQCQREGEAMLHGQDACGPDDADVVSLPYQQDDRDPMGLGGI